MKNFSNPLIVLIEKQKKVLYAMHKLRIIYIITNSNSPIMTTTVVRFYSYSTLFEETGTYQYWLSSEEFENVPVQLFRVHFLTKDCVVSF